MEIIVWALEMLIATGLDLRPFPQIKLGNVYIFFSEQIYHEFILFPLQIYEYRLLILMLTVYLFSLTVEIMSLTTVNITIGFILWYTHNI